MTDAVEREAFESADAIILRLREKELFWRSAHNAAIDWSWLPDRCPCCRMSWALFPPARIEAPAGFHSGEVRCVECKIVVGPTGSTL